MSQKRFEKIPVTQIGPYITSIPFNTGMYIVTDYILDSNDTLEPLTQSGTPELYVPVPGYGAIYRLVGDDTHIPVFGAPFKKSSGSGDYDETLNVVNLVTFLFDGVDYWYSIIQEA